MDELRNEAVAAELIELAQDWEKEYSTSANAFRRAFPLLAEILIGLGQNYGEVEEWSRSFDALVPMTTKEALSLYKNSNPFMRYLSAKDET